MALTRGIIFQLFPTWFGKGLSWGHFGKSDAKEKTLT